MRTKQGEAPKYNLLPHFEPEVDENKPFRYKIVDRSCNVLADFRTKEAIEAATVDGSFTFRSKNFVFRRRHAEEIKKAQEARNLKRFNQLITIVTTNDIITCADLFA